MATRYASIARCTDLPERDVIAALVSRDECAALLARIGAMGSPRSAARALAALVGRLATPACTWLEGALAIELFEEESGADVCVRVRVMSEIGGGLRERVLPVVELAQPLAELVAVLERRRDVMAMLHIEQVSARCALLLASDGRDESATSTSFDISETSLALGIVAAGSVTSDDVDSGWDDASSAE